MSTAQAVIGLISALLTGGFGKFLWDIYRDYRNRPPKAVREQATIDANILTVVRARDELEEDNVRIRATLAEERTRHAEDRTSWDAERARLREEAATWEQRYRRERAVNTGAIERLAQGLQLPGQEGET